MRRLAGRKVFTVGKLDYRWDDVVLAGHLWGAWAGLEQAVREEIACVKHLAVLGEWAREPDVEDEAGDAWRYDRNLLAADDLEAWLTERGLDEDAWLEYIERTVLRSQWSNELAEITKAHRVKGEEIEALVYADAVCSGLLSELAEQLAGRAAVHDRVTGGKKTPSCTKTEVRGVLRKLPRTVARDGVLGSRLDATRAERIACLEVVYRRFVGELAEPAAIEREISSHVLDWTRFDCTTVAFSSQAAAREGALLVREDGLPLAEAAAMAKAVVSRTHTVLEDAEPVLRDRLTPARPREVLGPLVVDGRHVLIGVTKRTEPTIKNAAIRKRAQERVIRRTIQREVGGRVAWHERF